MTMTRPAATEFAHFYAGYVAQVPDSGPVSDLQAQDWYQQDSEVWAVVVKPWILVQIPPSS